MLACYYNGSRLPRNDLVYLAFLLSLHETVAEIELWPDLDEDEDTAAGFLVEVPFLHPVPLPVQVDLLAETWTRHCDETLIEATLLDAAIVYAAFLTAANIVNDELEVAAAWLCAHGPRKVNPRILRRAPDRLDDLFESWWDDCDFLTLDEFQDMPPEQARHVKKMLGIPDVMLQPMFDALERGRVSPDAGEKLKGLLTADEVPDVVSILKRSPLKTLQPSDDSVEDDDESHLFPGLEDRYHDVLVGPCDQAAIDRESECLLVCEIGVCSLDQFDCTFEEWTEHLRDAVHRAAEQPDETTDLTGNDEDIIEKVKQALNAELVDGTRIERRERGWVVADRTDGYLVDVNLAVWVVGDDDEEMPPLFFDTPEKAYLAYEQAQRNSEQRMKRRDEALRRLSKR